MKPIIGMTACHEDEKIYKTTDAYVKAVLRAGGLPLLLPTAAGPEECARLAGLLDGLLIPGGVDMAPQFYGEEPRDKVTCFDRELDSFELALIRAAADAKKPMLAICRGIQVLNVAFGGSLYQDIPSQLPEAHGHYQNTFSRSEPYHTVHLTPGSHLFAILGGGELLTNSYHHQAIKKVAPGFTVSARAADGVIEGIENGDGSIIGVQWHPEGMQERYPRFLKLFTALTERAAGGQ